MHNPMSEGQATLENGVIGWGADAALENRPGVPHEISPPQPIGNGSLTVPSQQTLGQAAAKSPLHPMTPVYGTAQPLRGLSGVIRRSAYKMPDYKPTRWMMLLLADRVDVIEHNPVRVAVMGGILALGVIGIRRALKRK